MDGILGSAVGTIEVPVASCGSCGTSFPDCVPGWLSPGVWTSGNTKCDLGTTVPTVVVVPLAALSCISGE